MMKMTAKLVTVYINDIEVKVLENSTILQACEKVGVKVPRFCYHEKLSIAGNCRMCLVEIKNAPKLQASCAMPVMNDARIYTDSLAVRKAREGIMELLLINHPLDCPICDQGGECDLQDQAMYYGSDHGRFNEYKRATVDKNFGPLIKTIMTRCIHCTRCVRFASEIAGCSELGTIGRGSNIEISTFVRTNAQEAQSVLNSELSGNLIDLCPVGALTSLPYAFVARPWELKSIVSIDLSDTHCSEVKWDIRGQGPGSILRVLPATNTWISDKTRFAFDGFKRQRLVTPLQKVNNEFVSQTWEALFDSSSDLSVATKNAKGVTFFLGNHLDLETLKVIQAYQSKSNKKVNIQFVHNDSGRYGNNVTAKASSYIDNGSDKQWASIDSQSYITDKEVEKADLCVLVGTNPRVESPVLNASIQKVAKRGLVALFGSNSEKLPYAVKHLGISTTSLLKFVTLPEETIEKVLKVSKAVNKVLIVGASVFYRADAQEIEKALTKFASTYGFGKVRILYQSVSELSGLFTGVNVYDSYTSEVVTNVQNSDVFVYHNLPNYVLKNPLIQESLQKDKGVRIYIGSHGNELTSRCNFVLPTTAFTEKVGSYVANSGKVQKTTVVTYPLGLAKEDSSVFEKVFASK